MISYKKSAARIFSIHNFRTNLHCRYNFLLNHFIRLTASQSLYGTLPLLSGCVVRTAQMPACSPFFYRNRSCPPSLTLHQLTVFSPVQQWHQSAEYAPMHLAECVPVPAKYRQKAHSDQRP